MSFEEALSELQTIVKKLESGEESLENSISAYQYGNELRSHCEKKLSEAKLKIEKVVKKEGDQIELTSFDQD